MIESEPRIVPAIMPADYQEFIERSNEIFSFAPEIHLDITDGELVPKKGWPYAKEGQWQELRACAGQACLSGEAYSAHLMVSHQREVGELFANAGVTRIIGQYEAFATANEMYDTLHAWREAGCPRVGLALLIDTPLTALAPLLDSLDEVQIMSIATIGAQGYPFDERALERIAELRAMAPDVVISCDGGITKENALTVVSSGADRLIVGSAIVGTSNPAEAYQSITGLF